ncbi:DUF6197 family protein [Streptomyces youssoufiensis]
MSAQPIEHPPAARPPLPVRPVSLPELYRAAARLLTQVGHFRGDFFDGAGYGDQYAAGAPVCAVGALRLVAGGDPQTPSLLSEEGIAFLSARVESSVVEDDPLERVADWNDSYDRSYRDVIAELYAAADASEVAA